MTEKKTSARELRRVLGGPVMKTIGDLVHDNGVTRTKVTALEAKATEADAFREMTLGQRLRWLLRGVK